MKCFTFYKGVRDNDQLGSFVDKYGDIPECEMFRHKVRGDDERIKGAGFIAEETCDLEIYNQIPMSLSEALGD